MIKMLIQYGCDINAHSDKLTLSNTPLHAAVNGGNLKMVNAILACNANINVKNDLGLTPLALATLNGQTQIALHLLDKGSDPLIADNEGKTAYIHAKELMNDELLIHLPQQNWSLDDDPTWKQMWAAKLKQKADVGSGAKKKKGKKSKKRQKGK